jgi:hypothetical protein
VKLAEDIEGREKGGSWLEEEGSRRGVSGRTVRMKGDAEVGLEVSRDGAYPCIRVDDRGEDGGSVVRSRSDRLFCVD